LERIFRKKMGRIEKNNVYKFIFFEEKSGSIFAFSNRGI